MNEYANVVRCASVNAPASFQSGDGESDGESEGDYEKIVTTKTTTTTTVTIDDSIGFNGNGSAVATEEEQQHQLVDDDGEFDNLVLVENEDNNSEHGTVTTVGSIAQHKQQPPGAKMAPSTNSPTATATTSTITTSTTASTNRQVVCDFPNPSFFF